MGNRKDVSFHSKNACSTTLFPTQHNFTIPALSISDLSSHIPSRRKDAHRSTLDKPLPLQTPPHKHHPHPPQHHHPPLPLPHLRHRRQPLLRQDNRPISPVPLNLQPPPPHPTRLLLVHHPMRLLPHLPDRKFLSLDRQITADIRRGGGGDSDVRVGDAACDLGAPVSFPGMRSRWRGQRIVRLRYGMDGRERSRGRRLDGRGWCLPLCRVCWCCMSFSKQPHHVWHVSEHHVANGRCSYLIYLTLGAIGLRRERTHHHSRRYELVDLPKSNAFLSTGSDIMSRPGSSASRSYSDTEAQETDEAQETAKAREADQARETNEDPQTLDPDSHTYAPYQEPRTTIAQIGCAEESLSSSAPALSLTITSPFGTTSNEQEPFVHSSLSRLGHRHF